MKKKQILFLTLLLVMGGLLGILFGGYHLNYPYLEDPYQTRLYPLDNVNTTLKQLEVDRMIYSSQIITWVLILTGLDVRLQKGVYEIDNRMGTYQILKAWFLGKRKVVEIVIKEGEDLFDIGKTLLKKGVITDEGEWIKLVQSPEMLDLVKKKINFLSETRLHTLEGFLYPNTYYFFLGDPLTKFIDLALKEFQSQIQSLISLDASDDYKLKMFKMASLVEKETSVPEEKPLVASVIKNRLAINMKLRFDPSVIYTLKTTGQYHNNLKDGFINIKREHYSISSPYNTYYVKGLPLTPISSFSLSSLQAAMNSAKTDYLFFVAKEKGRPQSGHHFTSNYDDHLYYLNRMLKK